MMTDSIIGNRVDAIKVITTKTHINVNDKMEN